MINSTGLASCFVKTGSKEHHMEVSKKSSWSPWNFSSPFCGTGTAKNLVVQEPGTSDENNNSSCNDGEEITIVSTQSSGVIATSHLSGNSARKFFDSTPILFCRVRVVGARAYLFGISTTR